MIGLTKNMFINSNSFRLLAVLEGMIQKVGMNSYWALWILILLRAGGVSRLLRIDKQINCKQNIQWQ